MPYGFAAMSPLYLRGLLDRFETHLPIYKSRAVGPTTAGIENVIGYAIDSLRSEQPSGVHAFDGMNYEGEPQWSTKDSNPLDDIKATLELISSPEYKAAQQREYEYEMRRWARFLEAHGFGPLPKPYGSGP